MRLDLRAQHASQAQPLWLPESDPREEFWRHASASLEYFSERRVARSSSKAEEHLANNRECIEFEGTLFSQPLMGGYANVDDDVFEGPAALYRGSAPRSFNASRGGTGRMRMWQTIRASSLSRHVHERAYAALVLSGGYEEAGDYGRFQVKAGDVIFHEQFEAHLDRFSETGAAILNLPLPTGHSYTSGIARVADADAVARVAERSCRDAIELLFSVAILRTPQPADWPDELAATLVRNPSLKLSQWCEKNGIAPWTISRGFQMVFCLSPEAFRARSRARHALRSIQNTQAPLANIAAELGFADQSHMTRSVKQLTGTGPRAWRSAANRFKTEGNCDV
jgi:AraC-like DNA-binding protein